MDPSLVPSKLDENIYKFIRRICNSKITNTASINQLYIDWEILPQHSLTRDRLEKALSILKQIEEIIETVNKGKKDGLKFDNDTADLMTDLTNEYYELIPCTQYKTSSIPPITSAYEVSGKLKNIYDLMYSEVVIRLLCGAQLRIKEVHPVDYCFNSLSFKIMHVKKQEEEYQLIK